MDKYITKYLRAVNKAKTNEEKRTVLNKLYEDGFVDGTNVAEKFAQLNKKK